MLCIFKKAWNTTQLGDLTNYFATILTSYASITYVLNALSGYIPKLNTANTASGANSVTINAVSGVIEYSQTIEGEDYGVFTFENSRIGVNDVIFFSIKSPSEGTGGAGLPYVQSYSIVNNTVTVIIANSSVNSTSASFFLNFLVVD
jgi:hypothetical protein